MIHRHLRPRMWSSAGSRIYPVRYSRMVDLTETQKEIVRTDGHQLVTGGPGSGKTTVSILKAARIAREQLRPGQRVLFLSFARATVSRVMEAIDEESQSRATRNDA